MTEQLTTETFKEKVYDYTKGQEWEYEGSLPCIIDFYADWCGPCKMIAPILEELSEEYDGKIKIYKINTEEQQELSNFWYKKYTNIIICANGRRTSNVSRWYE